MARGNFKARMHGSEATILPADLSSCHKTTDIYDNVNQLINI